MELSQPASTYTVNQVVEGRWWADTDGGVPCAHREWYRASVVHVNAEANTLNLFYEDNAAASAVPAAHVRQSRQHAGSASGLGHQLGGLLPTLPGPYKLKLFRECNLLSVYFF